MSASARRQRGRGGPLLTKTRQSDLGGVVWSSEALHEETQSLTVRPHLNATSLNLLAVKPMWRNQVSLSTIPTIESTRAQSGGDTYSRVARNRHAVYHATSNGARLPHDDTLQR